MTSRWRAEDLVKRKFPASGINRRWYGDGTEIVTGEGKLYLDSVLDTGSRRILGHALGEHHDAALAVAAPGRSLPASAWNPVLGRRPAQPHLAARKRPMRAA